MVKEIQNKEYVNKIIVLIYIGYQCDFDFVKKVKGIDLIVGGYMYMFVDKMEIVKNEELIIVV